MLDFVHVRVGMCSLRPLAHFLWYLKLAQVQDK